MTTYGLLIFDGAEELDFTGPWEVFTTSSMLRDQGDTVVLISRATSPSAAPRACGCCRTTPWTSHPPLDVLLVPGGQGTRREVDNPAVISWIRSTSAAAAWTTSVCTGALLLHEAGPARGRRVATHFAFEDASPERGTSPWSATHATSSTITLVTSQGVSAGIDMALWLVGRLHGRDHSRAVRRYIQYEPAPPYLADEPVC